MTAEQLTAQILRDLFGQSSGESGSATQRLVDTCCVETPATGSSLTWSSGEAPPVLIAATVGAATALELLSFILDEGPEVSCSRVGRIILRPSLEDALDEWPAYTPEALREDVRAVFAFPLRLGAITVGVLTVYRSDRGPLSEKSLAVALAYAAAATALLLEPAEASTPNALLSGLEDPLDLHPEVHQATGMVAVQLQTDLRTALSLLRAHAYSSSQPISTIAREVVNRTLQVT